MKETISNNIYNLYIIKIAKWFMLIMPIIGLFYNHHGLNDFQLFIVQGSYSLSIVVFEIPSGYFADLWGRKTTLIIGTVCGTLGYVLYSFTNGFWGFLVAELILGIGESFVSGADSALLYDTLVHLKSPEKYLKFEGRVTAIGSFAETIASTIGGTLAIFSGLRAPFIVQSIVAAIGIPAAFMLVEPQRDMITRKPSIKHVFSIFHTSLFKDFSLSSALILSSIAGTATLTMAWVAQLLFIHHQIGETYTSILWVSLNFCVALVSMFAYHFNKHVGERKVLFAIVVYIPLAYICIPLSSYFWLTLLLLFLFYIIRGLATPILKEQVNSRCTSDVRATVLSIRSLLIRLLFSIVGPAIGWLSIKHNFNYAVFSLGIFLALALGISTLFFIRFGEKGNVKSSIA